MVAIPQIPVAGRYDTVDQAAIVKHRQIEATTIPGNDPGGEFLDAIKETLNDFGFRQGRSRQGPDLEALPGTHDTGNGDHPLQMQGQKIMARLGTFLLKGQFGHFGVGKHRVQAMQPAQAGHIRNGFDIENEDGETHFFFHWPLSSWTHQPGRAFSIQRRPKVRAISASHSGC